MKRNELFQERSSAMKKFSVVLILSLCVFFASCQSEEAPQTEKTAVPGENRLPRRFVWTDPPYRRKAG